MSYARGQIFQRTGAKFGRILRPLTETLVELSPFLKTEVIFALIQTASLTDKGIFDLRVSPVIVYL